MTSLIEKMKTLKKIQIESNEECVIQVTHKGMEVAELIFSISDIDYNLNSGKSSVKVMVINPNGIGEHEVKDILKEFFPKTN